MSIRCSEERRFIVEGRNSAFVLFLLCCGGDGVWLKPYWRFAECSREKEGF